MPLEPDHLWNRLIEQARQCPEETPEAPYGFTTRVIAQWKAQPQPTLLTAMNELVRRGLLGGLALCVVCTAFYCWPVDSSVDPENDWAASLVSAEDLL
jgi:hypothetical protein